MKIENDSFKSEQSEISVEESTILKGIAILLVIICHVGNMFTRLTTPLGGVGVAIFLILSGYGLTVSYLKNGQLSKSYWPKRIVGVWGPYAIMELLVALIGGDFNLQEFMLDILLIKPQFQLGWYIPYLFFWYFLFWVIHSLTKVIKDNTKRNKCNICFCAVAAVFLAIVFLQSGIRFEQSVSFLLGVICAYRPDIISRVKKFSVSFVLFCLSFLFLVLKQNNQIRQIVEQIPAWWDLIIKISAAVGLILFILLAIKRTPQCLEKSILFVGSISFELYLVHGYALSIFQTNVTMGLKLVCFLGVSFIGAIVFHGFNKKILRSLLDIHVIVNCQTKCNRN